jgi:hypothetical protein
VKTFTFFKDTYNYISIDGAGQKDLVALVNNVCSGSVNNAVSARCISFVSQCTPSSEPSQPLSSIDADRFTPSFHLFYTVLCVGEFVFRFW